MTSWTTKLRDELTDGKNILENAAQVVADFDVLSWRQWQSLLALRADAVAQHVTVRLASSLSQDGYDLLDDEFGAQSGPFRLFCTKQVIPQALRFLFWDHFKSFASREPSAVEAVRSVFVSDLPEVVANPTFSIRRWDTSSIEIGIDEPSTSPVHVVNDATGTGVVPVSLDPWFALWPVSADAPDLRATCVRRMALALATSIIRDRTNSLTALVDLKKKSKAIIEDDGDAIWQSLGGDNLEAAAKWVYLDGKDTDNRHSLLAAELSRSLPKGATWGTGLFAALPGALESARVAYRLHLYDKSIDALKLMSDLRKGLSEDVKAVASQTAALSAGLWRDAAVAVGAVAFKYVSGSAGVFVLLLTAGYLLASCYLNQRVAAKAVAAIKGNEATFRTKLFLPLLTSDEYKELAGDRYSAVLDEFDTYSKLVIKAYILAASLVVGFALWPQIMHVIEMAVRYAAASFQC